MNASPVPAQTTFGSEAATASAPIDATCWPSKIGVQWTPPSSVLKMPPDAAPAYATLESPGTPATATDPVALRADVAEAQRAPGC